ncbi:unnamed protein product [Cladocopium goreaui]|uniref:Lysophosphatidic acid phosphatase type 6 n=1 Tax=Cladocopium goreaui TaxID=2562237 RepID=A0A9P1BJJ1_9DINO|nr:unnamed protein product [Cladocopium goreaui]
MISDVFGVSLASRSRSATSRSISSLRLRHTQLLLRGGARTPLEPLEPESFWRSTLPNETLLRRHILNPTEGARRKVRLDSLWNQLTLRGMDESYALGRRIETWIFEHSPKNEDENEELPTTVITSPDQRSILTARAVLRGLCAKDRESDPMAVRLRTMRAALRIADIEDLEDLEDLEDVAMDLTELLALPADALEGAKWPRLLDAAETAKLFGLVPQGELDKAWKACLASAYRTAQVVGKRSRPLLRLTLEPPLLRKRGAEVSEKLRLVVLPGFSLLCWANALRLPRFAQLWPAPSGCFLVETLDDEDGGVFLRIWNPRNHLELRPTWHKADMGYGGLMIGYPLVI